MARHRRTLEEQLADAAGQSRATAGLSFTTPALAPITTEHLSEELSTNLDTMNADLALVDSKIEDAISDANAVPLTNERFDPNSLTVWPFVNGTVPAGALAPGAVGANDIADFSIAVRKFNSDRHHLY